MDVICNARGVEGFVSEDRVTSASLLIGSFAGNVVPPVGDSILQESVTANRIEVRKMLQDCVIPQPNPYLIATSQVVAS